MEFRFKGLDFQIAGLRSLGFADWGVKVVSTCAEAGR